MINPAIFIGEPLPFSKTIKIYPPSVRDVVVNPEFHLLYKLLTMTQDDVNDHINQDFPNNEMRPSPFEFLMAYCQYSEQFFKGVCQAIKLFCKAEPVFVYESYSIKIKDDFITEYNYFEFQNAIRLVCGNKAEKPPEPENPDENPVIRRIKQKARERDRIKEKQGVKDGISFNTCLVAICCMGIGITPLNIGEMSYASVGQIMKMMQDKEKYDIDIRSLLAGADSKKVKPKYWIRNTND